MNNVTRIMRHFMYSIHLPSRLESKSVLYLEVSYIKQLTVFQSKLFTSIKKLFQVILIHENTQTHINILHNNYYVITMGMIILYTWYSNAS